MCEPKLLSICPHLRQAQPWADMSSSFGSIARNRYTVSIYTFTSTPPDDRTGPPHRSHHDSHPISYPPLPGRHHQRLLFASSHPFWRVRSPLSTRGQGVHLGRDGRSFLRRDCRAVRGNDSRRGGCDTQMGTSMSSIGLYLTFV